MEEEKLKNIIERHTIDGKFNLASALTEQENMIRDMAFRIAALEEAMMFFSNWYNQTQRTEILIPEHLKKGMEGLTGPQDHGLIL